MTAPGSTIKAGATGVLMMCMAAEETSEIADRMGRRAWVVTSSRLPKYGPDGGQLPTKSSTCTTILDLEPGKGETVEDLAREAVTLLGAAVDRTNCAVLVGTRFTPIPGTGDAVAQACVVRRDGWSRAAFSTYWLTRHAPLAGRVAGASGYQQVHADAAVTEVLADRLGCRAAPFDGIGRLFFDDEAAMAAARATSEIRRDATEDEMRFIDHARSEVVSMRFLASAARAW